ncbi:MAG: hypothetical protein ACRYFV_01595 [Janthinobacterium lividum]
MIDKLLISLADFPDYVPFSVNIGAHLVDPHIRDAQTFDVQPLIPASLWAVLAAAAPGFAEDAAPASTALPLAFTAPMPTDEELSKLWYGGVRPLLVLEAARRMLLWHGLHITPNGMELTANQPVSDKQRNELRADLAGKASFYSARLAICLRAYLLPTTTTCGTPVRRRRQGGLQTSAI